MSVGVLRNRMYINIVDLRREVEIGYDLEIVGEFDIRI